LTVQFNPTNAGTRNGIVSISNDDSDEGTYTFAVQGFATEQEINLQGGSPATNIPNGSNLISNSINTDFGTTAGTRTYTIQNLGTSNLNLTSAWSSNSDFAVSYSPSTVTPGGTATVTVVFNPTSAGTKNATISIANNDSDEGTYSFNVSAVIAEQEINLQGNSINIPTGSTSYSIANNTDFGTIPFGSGSIVRTFTIQNTGGYTLSIWSSYDNSGDFSVSHAASTIAPGGTATLTVTFTPTSIGVKTATITIDNNDSNEGTYTFNVTANSTPTAPEINIISNGNNIIDGSNTYSTTNNTEFGETYLGITTSRTFTIQNTGSANLTISNTTITGANASQFDITTFPSATIAPGASSNFVIRYNAAAIGSNIAVQVNVISNDSDEATYNFNIRGTTINPEIDVLGNGVSIINGDTTPTTADWTNFGEIDTTTGTITRTFSITNQGTTNLIISNPTISGTHAADFTVTTNPSSTTFAAGVTRTFVVTFNPSASGNRNAIVNITNNDSNENPYTFHINGFGSNSEINLTGNSTSIVDGDTTPSITDGTDFGNTDITFETKTQTFVIQNTGTTNLNIDNPTITGTHAADFAVTTNPSTLSIAPGSSTSFVVTFNPSATSTRSATINIVNNDGNENPYNFNIRGNGTDTEMDVQGNTISIANGDATPSLTDHTDFGSTDINTGTLTRTFTIANFGTTSMTISNPTISGTNASDFTVTTNPSGTTFNGGSSRTFTITFNPSASGTRTALVTINNNDFNENPYTFAIQGFGNNVEINITGLANSIVNGDTTPTTTDGTDFGNVFFLLEPHQVLLLYKI
ncbi:beta strand repeat-containing protein, partial [Flavobacterium macrobrachii]